MKKEQLESRIEEVKTEIKSYNTDSVVMKRKRAKTELKQLKKQLEELPKFDIGQWYISEEFGLIFQVTKINGDWIVGHGTENGIWWTAKETDCYEECWFDLSKDEFGDTRKLNDSEVQTALIEEAKRRGFKEGVKFKLIEGGIGEVNNCDITSDYELKYESNMNRLMLDSGYNAYTIMKDGKWATIIKDKTIHLEEGDYTEAQLNDSLIMLKSRLWKSLKIGKMKEELNKTNGKYKNVNIKQLLWNGMK